MSMAAGVMESERTELLEELLTVAPVVVVTTDGAGRVVAAEGDGLRLAGLPADLLVGRPLLAELPADSELRAAIRAALTGRRSRGTHRAANVDWAFVATPRRGVGGTVDGVRILAFNAGDRGARERAERESEAKSRFLATVSHELRTPLNSILGFNQLLGSPSFGDLNERQHRYVDNIARSGNQLLALVNELLDLAKVGSGAMEFDLRPVSARMVAATVVDATTPLAAARGVSLELECGADAVVNVDERRLGQALLNLVSNALKLTPEGGAVTVSVLPRPGRVSLAVRDTGPGIAPEDRVHIFEEFRQLPSGAAAGGSGLGLPLARQLVERMGGTVDLESEVGAGSIFTIALPLA